MGICFKVTYGVYSVHLDGATTGHAVRRLVTAGMVEKDVSLIWVEDESDCWSIARIILPRR